MLLEIRGLRNGFGERTVIRDLDLSVASGELVCLLGSSGCGKTTILRMVGGYLDADAGSIRLEGQDITRLPPEARPVSTVFQSYALFPHLNVVENVAYGLKFLGVGRAAARERALGMLEAVDMAAYAEARVSEISGGQQQRVALARSLVLNPKLLLLDEPLSNLDAVLRTRMRAEIKGIQRSFGVAMLFVTHDQKEAMTLGDRVAILHDGRLEQVAPPEEVYNHPATEYCARFLGALNSLVWQGEAVHFRPEDVCVRTGGSLTGTVVSSVFLGDRRECTVDVAGSLVMLRTDKDLAPVVGNGISFDIVRETTWKDGTHED